MTKQYKYIGEIEVSIEGVGTVKPNQIISVDFEINHPLFVIIAKSKKRK